MHFLHSKRFFFDIIPIWFKQDERGDSGFETLSQPNTNNIPITDTCETEHEEGDLMSMTNFKNEDADSQDDAEKDIETDSIVEDEEDIIKAMAKKKVFL